VCPPEAPVLKAWSPGWHYWGSLSIIVGVPLKWTVGLWPLLLPVHEVNSLLQDMFPLLLSRTPNRSQKPMGPPDHGLEPLNPRAKINFSSFIIQLSQALSYSDRKLTNSRTHCFFLYKSHHKACNKYFRLLRLYVSTTCFYGSVKAAMDNIWVECVCVPIEIYLQKQVVRKRKGEKKNR
jgi:hypothetical protein